MKITELEIRYLKNKADKIWNRIKNNFFSKLFKNEKRKHYNNVDLKNITDNKEFWKTIKPVLSKKGISINISFWKDDNLIFDDNDVVQSFSNFVSIGIHSFGINNCHTIMDGNNPVDTAIKTLENRSSEKLIKDDITHY